MVDFVGGHGFRGLVAITTLPVQSVAAQLESVGPVVFEGLVGGFSEWAPSWDGSPDQSDFNMAPGVPSMLAPGVPWHREFHVGPRSRLSLVSHQFVSRPCEAFFGSLSSGSQATTN